MQRLREIGEEGLLKIIREGFPESSEELLVGIGDDSAVLELRDSRVLISTDTMSEGVHFLHSLFTPYQIAYKLVVSNVSDIHAMGGSPRWALLNLSIPADTGYDFIDPFLKGLRCGLQTYGVSLIGGDITDSQASVFTITMLGLAEMFITRSGACPGDGVYLTGPVGEAACGLELLKTIARPVRLEEGEKLELNLPWDDARVVLERFLLPKLPVMPGPSESITSMIDISDGLFIDLWRLCRESHVGARIYEEKLPLSRHQQSVAAFLGLDPYILMVSGGEDYQLLFTSPEDMEGCHRIGEVTGEGLSIVRIDGRVEEITPLGYQHFGS